MSSAEVLKALSAERERFLSEGTLVDTFAVVYYHSTRRIVQSIEAGQRRYPEICRAQVSAFHAAYVANRRAPEPHWVPYYEMTQGMLRRHTDPGGKLYALLERGIHAHVMGDLPRVLRATKPATLSWDDLRSDFFADDPLFVQAARDAFSDFDHATQRTHGLFRTTHRPLIDFGDWLLSRFGEGSAKVQHQRHIAWEMAVQLTPQSTWSNSSATLNLSH